MIWLYSFSPLCFNHHVRSPSNAILHNDLKYELAEEFSPKSPNDFSKSPTMISPNKFLQISKASAKRFSPKSPNVLLQNSRTFSPKRRQFFTESRRISVLQITEHVSSKSPTYLAARFVQTAEHSILNFQDILRISEQPTFFSVQLRRPSLRSLHTRATGFALYVMGGRLWFLGHTCFSYTCMGSTLDVMDYGPAKAESSTQN